MTSSAVSSPIDRGQIILIAFSWLAVGFFLGLLLDGGPDSRWMAVRAVGALLFALYFTRGAWRLISRDAVSYPVRREDVEHFEARLAERERTIGHK
jgi:hypothetical protein